MDKLRIVGGVPLSGETRVYGAKNAALPILAATVMASGTSVIEDVPELEDVHVMLDILKELGADVRSSQANTVEVDASTITSTNVPAELMRRMRSPMQCKVMGETFFRERHAPAVMKDQMRPTCPVS